MKKLLFFIIAALCLLASCSKNDTFDQDQVSAYEAINSKPVNVSVIMVSPDEDSDGNDTEEFIAAFDEAKALGAGTIIKLAEGEYHIGFIQISDFYGSFCGAGIGKTVIIPLMDLPYQDLYDQNLAPELIKFVRGDVKVSGMSFLNLEGEPCSGDELWAFIGLHDYTYVELPDLPENHKIKAVIDHVEFVSNLQPAGWSPFGVVTAINWGPDFCLDINMPYSSADVTITNCPVREMHYAFSNLGIEQGSTVITNNSPLNTIGGIWLTDNTGGKTLIAGNIFNVPPLGEALRVTDYYYGLMTYMKSNGCQYEISGNKFHTNGAWQAVYLESARNMYLPEDNKNPLLVTIKSNLFDLQGGTWRGINMPSSKDAIIRNNKFSGQANVGISLLNNVENALLLGNNFSNLIAKLCTIRLYGNNCTVIGSNNKDKVLNMGINNIITGVTVQNGGEDPAGQTVADNFRTWRDEWIKFHSH